MHTLLSTALAVAVPVPETGHTGVLLGLAFVSVALVARLIRQRKP